MQEVLCFWAARQGCQTGLPITVQHTLAGAAQKPPAAGQTNSLVKADNPPTAFPSHACRIDHYLGKEMMQNMITMRFSNRFLSPMWNAQHISNVQVCDKTQGEVWLHVQDMQGAMCSLQGSVNHGARKGVCWLTGCVQQGRQPVLLALEAGILVAAP